MTMPTFTMRQLLEYAGGKYGQTPTDRWDWLLLVSAHSTTPFDLLQTGGSAAFVLGLCLLVVGRLREVAPSAERAVAIFFGAGTLVDSSSKGYELVAVEIRLDIIWVRGRASERDHAGAVVVRNRSHLKKGSDVLSQKGLDHFINPIFLR